MRIASWIRKATNTLSEYVILKWFWAATSHECALVLTLYVQCLSCWLSVSLCRRLRCCVRIRFVVSLELEFLRRWTRRTCLWWASQFDKTHFTLVKVQLAGWTADVMDKLTVFKTVVVGDTTHMTSHNRTDVSEKTVASDFGYRKHLQFCHSIT